MDPRTCKTEYVVGFQFEEMWLLVLAYHACDVYTDLVLKRNWQHTQMAKLSRFSSVYERLMNSRIREN